MIRFTGDSRHLSRVLADNDYDDLVGQVPAVIGSPPYNVSVVGYPSGYTDHLSWPLYNAYAKLWAKAIHEILCPGGRAWVVVQQTVPADAGGPEAPHVAGASTGAARVPLAHIWMNALSGAGLTYRDIVLWVQDSFDGGTAWGSWCSPTAPNLRGSSELILLYHKGPWNRPPPPEWKGLKLPRGVLIDEEDGKPILDDDGKRILDPDEPGGDWPDLTRNVWKINPANRGTWATASAEKRRHILPALYPLDIPRRAIRLSTWPGEWVLDPWAGHCTTGFAADELGRESVMVDLGFDEELLAEIGAHYAAARSTTPAAAP